MPPPLLLLRPRTINKTIFFIPFIAGFLSMIFVIIWTEITNNISNHTNYNKQLITIQTNNNTSKNCPISTSLPKLVYFQHIQRAAGSWFCKLATTNFKQDAQDGMYRCEPKDPLRQLHRTYHYRNFSNIELLSLAFRSNSSVFSSQWDAFPISINKYNRFSLKEQNVRFVTILREPISRWCSWMSYGRRNNTIQDLPGFVSRRRDNYMVRHFSDTTLWKDWTVNITHLELAKQVLNQFDLVMIQELLNDQRVNALLRQRLYFRPLRSKLVNSKPLTSHVISCNLNDIPIDIIEKIRKRNLLDLNLYEWAKAKFEKELDVCVVGGGGANNIIQS